MLGLYFKTLRAIDKHVKVYFIIFLIVTIAMISELVYLHQNKHLI